MLLYGLVSGVWHECHEARNLDCVGNSALVLFAKLVALSRTDSEFRGHKLSENFRVLVVQMLYIVLAKVTNHLNVM